MLKRLRNKFLVMNMTLTSVVILIAFSAVLITTQANVNRDIEFKLHQTLGMQQPGRASRFPFPKPFQPEEAPGAADKQASGEAAKRPEDVSRFLAVLTDSGEVERLEAAGYLDEETYRAIAAAAVLKGRDDGTVKYEEVYWKYKKQLRRNGQTVIAFADVTSERGIMAQFTLTFAISAAVLLCVIFFLSLYFANRSIVPVREAWEKQRQFVADASHELKTPIAAIFTNIDAVTAHPENTVGEQKKWLDYIKCELTRMTKLTNDLLYLAKTDNDEEVVFDERVDLSHAVDAVVLTMEAVAFEKGIAVSCDCGEGIFTRGSAARLSQVIMILVDNAIKYTPEGGEIDIRLTESRSQATLTVENTGEGIRAEDLPKIFDRFYRADKARERENGSYGLGLAIAKAILEQSGGKIEAASEPGKRTRFVVSVPLYINPK